MNEIKYQKLGVTVTPETKAKLRELKDHFNSQDMGKFDNSYIINLAIKKLHETILNKENENGKVS
jgi:hypothetical protein